MKTILNITMAIFTCLIMARCNTGGEENAGNEDSQTTTQTAKEQAVVESVTPEEFRQKVESGQGVLLDVRTPEEYQQDHLEDAMLIDFYAPDFEEQLGELDRDTTYLVYCRSGNRSMQTAGKMKELGFKKVVNMDEGIVGWRNAGYETVK